MKVGDGQRVTIDWSALLKEDLDAMPPATLATALSLCDLVSKALGDRAKSIKKLIVEPVQTLAKKSGSSWSAELGDVEIMVTERVTRTVDEAVLRTVCDERGIEFDDLFRTETKQVLDDAKVERLFASGQIDPDDVRRMTVEKTVNAVKVKSHVGGLTKARLLKRV